jgi:hypothetical protein
MAVSKYKDRESEYLEPRVAKLETGLDRLAEDVKDLAGIVRAQGSAVESEIQKLVVAVTQAQAPRRTDWGTIISALFLVMAIGSAVFWPLNQTVQDSKVEIQEMHQEFVNHQGLQMHPVGLAKVNYMEDKFVEVARNNRESIESLDKKLQRETELLVSEIRTQIQNTSTKYDKEIQNLGDRLIGRLNAYDAYIMSENQQDLAELRMWRLKGMGMCNKEAPILPVTPNTPNVSTPTTPVVPNLK